MNEHLLVAADDDAEQTIFMTRQSTTVSSVNYDLQQRSRCSSRHGHSNSSATVHTHLHTAGIVRSYAHAQRNVKQRLTSRGSSGGEDGAFDGVSRGNSDLSVGDGINRKRGMSSADSETIDGRLSAASGTNGFQTKYRLQKTPVPNQTQSKTQTVATTKVKSQVKSKSQGFKQVTKTSKNQQNNKIAMRNKGRSGVTEVSGASEVVLPQTSLVGARGATRTSLASSSSNHDRHSDTTATGNACDVRVCLCV